MHLRQYNKQISKKSFAKKPRGRRLEGGTHFEACTHRTIIEHRCLLIPKLLIVSRQLISASIQKTVWDSSMSRNILYAPARISACACCYEIPSTHNPLLVSLSRVCPSLTRPSLKQNIGRKQYHKTPPGDPL